MRWAFSFIKNNKYNLDIKWISDDDNLDDVTIEELFSEIQKESENISNIVAKLDALINGE